MVERTMKRSSVKEEFDMVFKEKNIEKARENLRKKIDDFEDEKKLGDAHHFLAYIHNRKGEIRQACGHLKKSEELRRAVDDKEGLADTLSFLGTVEKEKGNEEKGLESLSRAADLAKELENYQGAGTFYGMVANGYEELGKTEEVFNYQSKAIEMIEELDKEGESTSPIEVMIFTKEGGEKLRDLQGKRIEAFKEEYDGESEILAQFEAFDKMEESLSALREELEIN